MQTETLSSLQESLESRNDNELVAAHLNGDKDAFTEIERRHHHELFMYLCQYLGNAEAEDVCQQTFLQLHLKAETYDPKRSLKTWLFIIARNQAVDWRRRKCNRPMLSLDASDQSYVSENVMLADILPGPDLPADEILEVKERITAVRAAIKCLPQPVADAMHMVHWQGMKYSEVADVSGVSISTIKSRTHSAIVRLEELLGDLMKNS